MNVWSGIFAALVVIAAMAPLKADAKECIKGAIGRGHSRAHGRTWQARSGGRLRRGPSRSEQAAPGPGRAAG